MIDLIAAICLIVPTGEAGHAVRVMKFTPAVQTPAARCVGPAAAQVRVVRYRP